MPGDPLVKRKLQRLPMAVSEVMLGDPFKFDTENIAEWKEVYDF